MNELTLIPRQYDSVAWLTIERFSRHLVELSPLSSISAESTDLGRVVAPIIDGTYSPEDMPLLGTVADAAGRMMNSVGEEPSGADFYPFKAAELVAMSADFLLTTPRNEKSFRLILQWIDRYAGNVDWEMRQSRIWPDVADQFEGEEVSLRLALSRLSGGRDASFDVARGDVIRLADLQISAVRCCLTPESSCQYVITVRMSTEELAGLPHVDLPPATVSAGSGEGCFMTAGRRIDVAVSDKPLLYFSTNADRFDRADQEFCFVYVWETEPAVIRDMVEAIGPRAQWVDYRDRSERLIYAQQFHEVMSVPDQVWS